MISDIFSYDGINSYDMGVSLVRSNTDLPNKIYTSGKDILEQFPDKNLYPHFFGVKYQPIDFTITISCVDGKMSSDKMYKLANWLFQDEYKPFISADNPSIQYYAMATNASEFFTNGNEEGYFEIEFRCRDGFGWTVPIIDEYDFTGISSPQTITLNNSSNVLKYIYPEINFELTGANTDFKLKNLNDGGREFEFIGVDALDEVYIDNRKKIVIAQNTENIFSKFNKKFFRLIKGANNIELEGECIFKIKKEFPVFIV